MRSSCSFGIILFCLISYVSTAQETRFFMPLEIQKAYEKGTRSYDGNPGDKYWQNTADYDISVTVDPPQKMLAGKEKVTYYNNSPDVLSTLVIRLYADVYKKGNIRLVPISPEDVSDGVDIRQLAIDGEPYALDNPAQITRTGTNLLIRLRKPVPPEGKVTLEVEWSEIVPVTNRRNGVSDSTSFFVGYWYPQVAVYDDVFGWDRLDYTFRTEMYNNLGNFDVKITLPASFCVWATGELQNGKDVLPGDIFERFEQARTSSETVTVIGSEDLDNFSGKGNTWHFKAAEVSDFAFCLSDHYQWDATSLKVGTRDVLINAVYPKEAQGEAFANLAHVQQQAMKFMSEDFPGIEYPYPVFTTFIGKENGGMEYPMMANNGYPNRGVTVHEMFHTYFPMYVRVNERKYAWMDEGWAQFNTAVLERYYFEQSSDPYYTGLLGASSPMGSTSDLPLITSSQFTDDSNYGYSAYPLPAFIYGMIYEVLGHDTFMACYRAYIQRWAKKSPTPYDFFYTFENVSQQDLSFIWKPWFFAYGYADVNIESFQNGKLTLVNKGNKTIPIVLNIRYMDGSDTSLYANANAWSAKGKYERSIPQSKKVKIILANVSVPDANPNDNIYPSLESITKENVLDAEVPGNYMIAGPNLLIEIALEDNLYYLRTPDGNTANLIPVDNHTLQTLDGMITLNFKIAEGMSPLVNVSVFGQSFTGKKL